MKFVYSVCFYTVLYSEFMQSQTKNGDYGLCSIFITMQTIQLFRRQSKRIVSYISLNTVYSATEANARVS
jgi:hypothetical protein